MNESNPTAVPTPRGACAVDGCTSKSIQRLQRGLCQMHYWRLRTKGDIGPPQHLVERVASIHRGPWRGCWEWTGSCVNGYGRASLPDRRFAIVHRAVYEAIYGPIPDGLVVCHRCDNPPCYRPDHLFLGTQADNVADKIAKGREARGEQVGSAKLTAADVRTIRERVARGDRVVEIAATYNVDRDNIYRIARRETWRHVA